MKQISIAPILAELNNPSTLDAQAAALRALKNEVIGHQQRKELWIRHGVVAPLARILHKQRVNTPAWQDAAAPVSGRNGHEQPSTDEDVLIQAMIVVGSLAQGGPQFVLPLVASQMMAPLASILDPAASSPAAVLAALRALNTIADSSALEQRPSHEKSDWALSALYTEKHLGYIAEILNQESPSLITQQQISLAASLVSKTCQEESHRKQLAYSGVLEALACRVASFIVLVAEQRHAEQRRPGPPPRFAIPAATQRARLAPILHAIGTIITNSSNRVSQFLRAPSFSSVSQRMELEGWKIAPPHPRTSDSNTFADSGTVGSIDRPSPPRPTTFPPLGEMARWGKPRLGKGSNASLEESSRDALVFPEDEESPVTGWLAHVIQAEQGVTRLMAAWLLAIFFREGRASKSREKVLGMQLIPILVRMLEADNTFPKEIAPSYDDSVIQPPRWLMKRLAPLVLGLLVGENEYLQKAASEAGAIKKLSQLLKQTFDPLPQIDSAAMWSPDGPSSDAMDTDTSASFCKLGPQGLTLSAYQVLLTRASVILGIASMATRSDEYRKSIITNGVVPYLISSLKSQEVPAAATAAAATGDKPDTAGNPIPVLMQACAAATALSRSVSTLRTSLVEAGLATPIFQLLQHPDVQVQIAATGAVCNIVLEFSPMRQDVVEAGVLTTLCKHAHSSNSQLRLNSLWALKHLVHSASNQLKISCVEELGASWLKAVMSGELDDRLSGSAPLTLGSSNAAGEQVDLLNSVAVEHGASFSAVTDPGDDDEVHMVDSIGNLSRERRPSTPRRAQLAADEEAERVARSRRDEVLVQEQGLDLLRNLLAGNGSAEMIDYIFQEFGQDVLLSMLTSLLRHRSGLPGPTGSTAPHPEIVLSVVFILVHLATGYPRHRSLLLAQTDLMRVFVPLVDHPSGQVRMAYAWFVINLTWVEDSGDKLSARARAHELRKLRMEDHLDVLVQDAELDVRERAKQAGAALHELLKS